MDIIMDSKMSAKAVFNVWSSEPDTLKILDVRSPEDFRAAHVPTSEHIELVDVVNFILKQDNKILYVIMAKSDFVSEELTAIPNVAIIEGGFSAWTACQYPTTSKNDLSERNYISTLKTNKGDPQ